MTIREIVEATEKEIQGHRAAILRLETVKERILGCCRSEPDGGEGRQARTFKIGVDECQETKRPRRRAA